MDEKKSVLNTRHNTSIRLSSLVFIQVPLSSSVDVWLSALLKSIHESLYCDIKECINDIDASQSIEEWAGKVFILL